MCGLRHLFQHAGSPPFRRSSLDGRSGLNRDCHQGGHRQTGLPRASWQRPGRGTRRRHRLAHRAERAPSPGFSASQPTRTHRLVSEHDPPDPSRPPHTSPPHGRGLRRFLGLSCPPGTVCAQPVLASLFFNQAEEGRWSGIPASPAPARKRTLHGHILLATGAPRQTCYAEKSPGSELRVGDQAAEAPRGWGAVKRLPLPV